MLSPAALTIDDPEQFQQNWEAVCDRYESQFDKIAKGISLSEYAGAIANEQYTLLSNDLLNFQESRDNTAGNRETLNFILFNAKALDEAKANKFNEIISTTIEESTQEAAD